MTIRPAALVRGGIFSKDFIMKEGPLFKCIVFVSKAAQDRYRDSFICVTQPRGAALKMASLELTPSKVAIADDGSGAVRGVMPDPWIKRWHLFRWAMAAGTCTGGNGTVPSPGVRYTASDVTPDSRGDDADGTCTAPLRTVQGA